MNLIAIKFLGSEVHLRTGELGHFVDWHEAQGLIPMLRIQTLQAPSAEVHNPPGTVPIHFPHIHS